MRTKLPLTMAEATETSVWREDEQSKVESWRLHVLIEAGFPLPLAERRALASELMAVRREMNAALNGSSGRTMSSLASFGKD